MECHGGGWMLLKWIETPKRNTNKTSVRSGFNKICLTKIMSSSPTEWNFKKMMCEFDKKNQISTLKVQPIFASKKGGSDRNMGWMWKTKNWRLWVAAQKLKVLYNISYANCARAPVWCELPTIQLGGGNPGFLEWFFVAKSPKNCVVSSQPSVKSNEMKIIWNDVDCLGYSQVCLTSRNGLNGSDVWFNHDSSQNDTDLVPYWNVLMFATSRRCTFLAAF